MSPKFLEESGFTFRIFSNEEIRMHIHVYRELKEAKFWLEPSVEMAYNKGFNKVDLSKIIKIIRKNEEDFKEKYRRHIR